jgi:hypothetical protein
VIPDKPRHIALFLAVWIVAVTIDCESNRSENTESWIIVAVRIEAVTIARSCWSESAGIDNVASTLRAVLEWTRDSDLSAETSASSLDKRCQSETSENTD